MRRSKLETYVDILQTLAQHGPLKLTHVMYKANLNCNITKELLDFLLEKSLVEERIAGKRTVVYRITQGGINVVKYFREVQKALPFIEETQKRSPATFY